MYCIGLTGSIASGKSTITALFAQKNIDIIDADKIAKTLVEPGLPALQEITHHFGQEILTAEGTLDRRHLRQLIMDNTKERAWLESLLHPLIRQRIQHDCNHSKSAYCMVEIPLLLDRKDYPYLNRVLYVKGQPELQISRLMARDHCSEKQAITILNATHAHDDKRYAIADDVIINDGTLKRLNTQVELLHHNYLAIALTRS